MRWGLRLGRLREGFLGGRGEGRGVGVVWSGLVGCI